MNDINDVTSYDLPEIGIKSLRDYQDIKDIKDKGLDTLMLQTSDKLTQINHKVNKAPAQPPSSQFLQTEAQM